jgi:hypothetical protein
MDLYNLGIAISHGIHAKSIDSAKAGGLQKTVFMSKSAKVMLSVNLCVSFGLYNGAIGKIITNSHTLTLMYCCGPTKF